MNRKAQIWYLDFILGLTIFLLTLVAFIAHVEAPAGSRTLEDVLGEAAAVSDSLISAGFPYGWDESNVQRIGITDGDHRVNSTLLARFANLSYAQTKSLFGSKYEYTFFFEDGQGNKVLHGGQCLFGYAANGPDCTFSVNTDDLGKIERLLIYNSTLTRLVLYAWN